ncbi:hypothetical protein KDW36_17120 [Burkholderia dolosa]|nr:hypothetical protein [Burkholderia dolosa]MBR8314909.1 hypothetical protein [Burkholderia dolosa]
MRRLLASKLGHAVAFQLATPKNGERSDMLDAFRDALAEQSGAAHRAVRA